GGNMNLLQKVNDANGNPIEPLIYDPLTTCTNPDTRDPSTGKITMGGCNPANPTFTPNPNQPVGINKGDRLLFPAANGLPAGHVIPAGRINPTAVNYINKFYPVSKVAGNANKDNFTNNAGIGGQNFETVVRVDHKVSDKQN